MLKAELASALAAKYKLLLATSRCVGISCCIDWEGQGADASTAFDVHQFAKLRSARVYEL